MADSQRVLSDEAEVALATRYKDGSSMNQLAQDFGCSRATVRNVLRRRGVQARHRGGSHKEFSETQVNTMVERWRAGDSQTAIAAALGTSQSAVSRMLRSRGVEPCTRIPSGARHSAWKGGRLRLNGYVMALMQPSHAFAQTMRNHQGYVFEHRLVMAEALGRALEAGETVHHINGVRDDNRIENLQLRHGQHGKGAAYRCQDCGSHNVQPVPLEDTLSEKD